MPRKILLFLFIFCVISIAVGIYYFSFYQKQQISYSSEVSSDKFITANPVDLSQMRQISKYRSCAGHDYSGKDATTGLVETNRSMKHYFLPKYNISDQLGVIKVFSPIKGTITDNIVDQVPLGTRVTIAVEGQPWKVIIFHIDLLQNLQVGSLVTPGELLGYAHTVKGGDFDIALSKTTEDTGQHSGIYKDRGSESPEQKARYLQGSGFAGNAVLDSIFNHMSDNIYALYVQHGVNLSNVIIPAAQRDARPCDFTDRMHKDVDWIDVR